MLSTVHVAVGALVGQAVKDPGLTAVVSFVSHYFLDAVPHFKWTKLPLTKKHHLRKHALRKFWYETIEPMVSIILAASLIYLAPSDVRFAVLIGIIFNQIPDLLVFLEWKYGIKRPFPIRQIEIATHRHTHSVFGVLNQLVVLAPVMYYLLK